MFTLHCTKKLLDLKQPVAPVGLVTSPGSAAHANITATFTAARTPVRLLEEHATLTGPTAPPSVAAAITRLAAARPDLIIVARRGGATAELATFDSEAVANAIAASPVPIITPPPDTPPTSPLPTTSLTPTSPPRPPQRHSSPPDTNAADNEKKISPRTAGSKQREPRPYRRG